jgi:O-antigen/teichoic acid export membrane protein
MGKRLAKNPIANVLQMGLSAVLLFILYRYLAATLGIAKLGVWSVVLASASASRLAEFGLSASVTRFVAKYLALGEPRLAAAVIETAALTLSGILALVLAVAYPVLCKILALFFDANNLPAALSLLPYALLSLWFSLVAAVFQSGLDGCERMDVRAGLMVIGQGLLLALAFWLVPLFGLIGLAWAQVGQGGFFLIFGGWSLRHHLPQLARLPWRWRKDIFREMVGYGANVQLASLAMILFDPMTKALMAKFGGVTSAGYFEMASQVVIKVRALIVAANRAIVPRVAQVNEVLPQRVPTIYRENMRLLILVTLPAYTLVFAWASFVSRFLLGELSKELIFFMQLAAAAWALNTFSGPAYFANLGTGRVGWNTLSHVTMGGLNGIAGVVLGICLGAKGVALGYCGSLVAGSLLLIAVFHKMYAVPWRALALRENLYLLSATIFVLAYAVLEGMIPFGGEGIRPAVLLLLPPLMLGVAVWFHPLSKHLWEIVFGVPTVGTAK